jgi:ABC-2 type transport system ATP-binding protein
MDRIDTARPSSAIHARSLGKAYGEIRALDSLDLTVPRNCVVGFLGPNGAGKSTTIKLLLGLIRPTSGTASVLGLDIVRDSMEIRRRVGYLAQQPRFYAELTVRDTLRFAARFYIAGPDSLIEARVEEALTLVGMSERAGRRVGGLSGGELQRVGIAQAWVNRPEILILDEPASALDPMGRRDVLDLIAGLREHSTVFFSTHILDDVQRVSDRVAILAAGRLVAEGPMEAFLAGPDRIDYELTARGAPDSMAARLRELPWVVTVERDPSHEGVRWRVTVTDERMAESQLLRHVLAEPAVEVASFGRVRQSLEDVFMAALDGETA